MEVWEPFDNLRKERKWVRAVRGQCNQLALFTRVMEDAIAGKEVLVKGGSYYQCAKFIAKYHRALTFTKREYSYITCCNAYPKICGGTCCRELKLGEECGCWKLPKSEHIRNCYDDCCNVVKVVSRRHFYLQWIKK